MPSGTVIVIPGFGGTTLSYRGGKGGSTPLWYDQTRILLNTPLSLALDTDGVKPFPLAGKTLFPAGPVNMGIYEPLVTAIANAGYTPIFWPYDWRLDPNATAAQLVAYLRGKTFTPPVSFVCHSFGGLIAQLAYPLFNVGAPPFTWSKTIYLGTPHGGAHWASAALNGIYFDGCELLMLAQLLDLVNLTFPIVQPAFTAVARTLALTVGSWPALYCLLPNPFGYWQTFDPNAARGLAPAQYVNGPGGVQTKWLALATSTLQTLVANLALSRPPEVSIYGLDFATMAQFNTQTDPTVLTGYLFQLAGDGTVTETRATLPAGHSVGFKRTSHNGLCNTLGPLNEVIAALATTPSSDSILPNPPGVVLPPTQTFTTIVTPPPTIPFANRHSDP